MLEDSYFGDTNDTLALGPSSVGRLNNLVYRNVRHRDYASLQPLPLAFIKELTHEEAEDWEVVSFPRVLRLPKNKIKPRHQGKIISLIEDGLVRETLDHLELTNKGKCYISDIHFFLMDDKQKRELEEQVDILRLE